MTGMTQPPLILIHGFCHGAWCWEEHLAPWLRSHGHAVITIDLRCHGSRRDESNLRFIPLARYVDDLTGAALELGRPSVLVGHSMGGAIVQQYLSRGGPAAGAVLVASAPHYGILNAALRFAARHPLRFLRVNATLGFRPMIETTAAFRDFFTPATPEAIVEEAQLMAQNDSYRAFLDMLLMGIRRPRRSTIPTLVLAASHDAQFSTADQRRLAAYHRAEFTLFEGMGHDMMLDIGWEAVVKRIDAFVETLSAESTGDNLRVAR
jgi:pimeloyl-ACP methyl ester carboxylesterase